MQDPQSIDSAVRKQLRKFLESGHAHLSWREIVDEFPEGFINEKIAGINYSAWQLLEHIRIVNLDILSFIRDPNYKSPPWPEGYWPDADAVAEKQQWQKTIYEIQNDMQALVSMVNDTDSNLYVAMPQGAKYNLLRELMLVGDHNAYHFGQLMLMAKHLKGR